MISPRAFPAPPYSTSPPLRTIAAATIPAAVATVTAAAKAKGSYAAMAEAV